MHFYSLAILFVHDNIAPLTFYVFDLFNITEPRISLTKDGDIAIVTLNRERKMNALDMPMFDAIVNTVNQLQVDRTLRCVIIRGSGSAFCSGLDFKSVMSNPLNINKLLKRKEGIVSSCNNNLSLSCRKLWWSVSFSPLLGDNCSLTDDLVF